MTDRRKLSAGNIVDTDEFVVYAFMLVSVYHALPEFD